jgi:4'-phosphopantetheinyl transferase
VKTQNTTLLKEDEIHIWSAYLPDFKENKAYLGTLLSKDECERAKSFKFTKDNEQFTIGRSILRCILAKYVGELPQTLEILYGLWGKPYIPEEKLLHFNVSHSGDYALYAVTRSYEVGIDLEYIDKTLDLENIALSVFSQPELKYWRGLSPANKVDFFFKLWVGKEAFLKATGKGWLDGERQMPLNCSQSLKQNLRKETSNSQATYPYFFNSISGFASALFVEGPSLNVLFYHYNSKE